MKRRIGMKRSTSRTSALLIALAGMAFLTFLDQYTKWLAVRHLKGEPSMELIPGVFELTYLENRGAAWGMFKNFRWLFLLLTAAILIALTAAYIKSLPEKKYRLFRILAIILASGALGNAIDRLFHGYVVDFFYFSLINFPVFNVADCYVTVSILLFLLIYRKEVLAWIQSES